MAWWVLAAKALPYIAAALSGGKKKADGSQDSFSVASSLLPRQNWNNPYVDQTTNQFNNVMSNGYNAISNAQRSRMYNQRANNIQQDIIKPSENSLASRLSRSGLAGSRIGAKALASQTNAGNRMKADAYNSIEDQNVQYTQQARQQAMSSAPAYANMYNNQQTALADQWMQLGAAQKGQASKNNESAMWEMLGNMMQSWGNSSGKK